MKTYGIIFQDGSNLLVSIILDEKGEPRMDTLRPYPLPDDWVDPQIVPLIKIDRPAGENWEPHIVWFADRVERQWIKK